MQILLSEVSLSYLLFSIVADSPSLLRFSFFWWVVYEFPCCRWIRVGSLCWVTWPISLLSFTEFSPFCFVFVVSSVLLGFVCCDLLSRRVLFCRFYRVVAFSLFWVEFVPSFKLLNLALFTSFVESGRCIWVRSVSPCSVFFAELSLIMLGFVVLLVWVRFRRVLSRLGLSWVTAEFMFVTESSSHICHAVSFRFRASYFNMIAEYCELLKWCFYWLIVVLFNKRKYVYYWCLSGGTADLFASISFLLVIIFVDFFWVHFVFKTNYAALYT